MQTYIKKSTLQRLKTIRGHLNHEIAAVEDEKSCVEILQQSAAVQSAIRSFDSLVLKGHLEDCASKAFHKKGEAQKRSITEIVDVFKKGRK